MRFQVQPQVRSKVRSLMNVAPHGVDLLLSLELDLVGSAVRLLVTVVLYQKIRWDPFVTYQSRCCLRRLTGQPLCWPCPSRPDWRRTAAGLAILARPPPSPDQTQLCSGRSASVYQVTAASIACSGSSAACCRMAASSTASSDAAARA